MPKPVRNDIVVTLALHCNDGSSMLAVSRLITDTLDCWLESRHDMTTMHPRYLPHTCPILITLGFVISSQGHNKRPDTDSLKRAVDIVMGLRSEWPLYNHHSSGAGHHDVDREAPEPNI